MLSALLEKLGLSYDSLTAAEKETWSSWAKTLAVRDVTTDDLRAFFAKEQERVDAECRKRENDAKTQLYFQMYATFLADARAFLEAPGRQRDELKVRLKKQFNIDV